MGAYDSIHAFPLHSSLQTCSMQEEIKASRLQTSGSSGLKKLRGIRAGALDMSLWILKWALLPTAILWRAMLMEGWYIPSDSGSCACIFFAGCLRASWGGEKNLFSLKFVRQNLKLGANRYCFKRPKHCFSDVQSYHHSIVLICAVYSPLGFLYSMQKQLFFFARN